MPHLPPDPAAADPGPPAHQRQFADRSVDRRQVLAALVGGVALAGCSRSGGHESDSPSARPGASVAGTAESATPRSPAPTGAPDAGGPQRGDGPDSANTVMTSALAAEAALLAAYDATLHRHPSLARTLRPVRAEHAAHLAALRRATTPAGDRAGAGPAGAGEKGGVAGPTTGAGGKAGPALPGARATRRPAVPPNPAAAVAALAGAERSAAAARVADCVAAPRELAPLLASIGASEAAHLPALRTP